jgi:hypothetical protein
VADFFSPDGTVKTIENPSLSDLQEWVGGHLDSSIIHRGLVLLVLTESLYLGNNNELPLNRPVMIKLREILGPEDQIFPVYGNAVIASVAELNR